MLIILISFSVFLVVLALIHRPPTTFIFARWPSLRLRHCSLISGHDFLVDKCIPCKPEEIKLTLPWQIMVNHGMVGIMGFKIHSFTKTQWFDNHSISKMLMRGSPSSDGVEWTSDRLQHHHSLWYLNFISSNLLRKSQASSVHLHLLGKTMLWSFDKCCSDNWRGLAL
jgi:hypothetical protein